jgi:formylglycine-generating enzyme required for sulfatase activity
VNEADHSLLHEHEIHSPEKPYFLHAHEVTWAELDEWLKTAPEHKARIHRPRWASDPTVAARLPATGVPWEVASRYCSARPGRRLPSEMEWEYAARGPDLRRFPWGNEAPDLQRVHAYAGQGSALVEVMSQDQDRTASGIHDLMGNAQEWTATPWHSWERPEGPQAQMHVHVVRGLPVDVAAPPDPSIHGAAFRERVCWGHESCPDGDKWDVKYYVGFRCAWSE